MIGLQGDLKGRSKKVNFAILSPFLEWHNGEREEKEGKIKYAFRSVSFHSVGIILTIYKLCVHR